jgi:hypothetical protein
MGCKEDTERCLQEVKAKPDNRKAGMEEMDAVMDVFKERLDKTTTIHI